MKYPEYDSPFELILSDITTQVERNIDEMSWQAIQRVGINADKEKLLSALKQNAERYREAYAKGHETGYTKRDEEIIRCKDCRYGDEWVCKPGIYCSKEVGTSDTSVHMPDWFCAEGDRKEEDESHDYKNCN